jgi:hypothetical protein
MEITRPARRTVAIIPCGAAKLDRSAPARDLYTGSQFRMALAAAAEIDDEVQVLVLSAKYGLITLDTILDPYDVKMGDAGSVDPCDLILQASALELNAGEVDVYALLPKAYFETLDEALRFRGVYAADVYEADAGIGYQRGTLSTIVRTA